MTFIGIISLLVGFVMALKLPFFAALIILILVFIFAVNSGEGFENVFYLVQSWCLIFGSIAGWAYFYINFQPETGLTIAKAAHWIFNP
jgi:hypothetical protein